MKTGSASDAPTVVIGVGHPMRGDDGVGPAAAAQLRRRRLDAAAVDVVIADGEPTRLLDLWRGRHLAIVVDAVRAGAPPGTIHLLDCAVDALPGARPSLTSHRPGLADAVALGRALGRMPDRLFVYGVEPDSVELGVGLSPPVADALPRLLHHICGALGARRGSTEQEAGSGPRVASHPPPTSPRKNPCT